MLVSLSEVRIGDLVNINKGWIAVENILPADPQAINFRNNHAIINPDSNRYIMPTKNKVSILRPRALTK